MLQRSFSKSTFIHVLGGMVATGGNLLLAPFYLRLLSADDYGVWSRYILAVQVLQPLLCWGLLTTLTRLLADTDAKRRSRLIAAGLRLASGLNLLIIAVFAACIAVLRQWAPDVIHSFFLFAAAAAALSAYPAMLMGIYVSDNDALRYRSVGLIGFVLQVVVLALATLWGPLDVHSAVIAMLLSAGFYAFFAILRLWSHQVDARPGRADYLVLLSLGVPVVLYTLTGQLSDFMIRGLVATQVSWADFGAFSAGLLFASIIAMGSSAVNLAWIPLYYRKAKDWNTSGVYSRFVEAFSAITALAAAFVIVFSEELLTVYSGGSVQLPVSTMAGLVIAAWLNSAVWMSLSNPLFQQQRMRSVLVLVVVATALSMPLAWLMIVRLGLLGASWSLTFSALILCVLAVLMLRYRGISGPNYLRLVLLLALLVILSGPWLNGLYLQNSGWLRIAGKSMLMAAAITFTATLFWRRSLQVIKQIESDISS